MSGDGKGCVYRKRTKWMAKSSLRILCVCESGNKGGIVSISKTMNISDLKVRRWTVYVQMTFFPPSLLSSLLFLLFLFPMHEWRSVVENKRKREPVVWEEWGNYTRGGGRTFFRRKQDWQIADNLLGSLLLLCLLQVIYCKFFQLLFLKLLAVIPCGTGVLSKCLSPTQSSVVIF